MPNDFFNKKKYLGSKSLKNIGLDDAVTVTKTKKKFTPLKVDKHRVDHHHPTYL